MTPTATDEIGTSAIAFQLSHLQPPPPDQDVLDLVSGDWDEPETLMSRLIAKVRSGDVYAAWNLVQATLRQRVGARFVDDAFRALALETLAAARVPALEPTVREAILELLESRQERLRFAAIAAASDLAPAGIALVSWAIAARARDLAETPSVRAAADAFLRSHRAAKRAAGI